MFGRAMFLSLALAVAAQAAQPAPARAQGAAPAPASSAASFGAAAPNAPAPNTPAPGPAAPAEPQASPSPTPRIGAVGQDYRLGARDKVRIIVYGEPALSGEFFVSGGGLVSFPLVGDVQAANLTVQAFQAELETALRQGYLKDPKVSAEVLTYRPFYILGEVNRPGEYPYSNGLNVLNAVATAGGFTYRAQKRNVHIRRVNETAEKSYPLTSDLVVSPGDTIRVTERFF